MSANSKVFLSMSEQYYLDIPSEVRECYLSCKRVNNEISDFKENMQDQTFKELYNKSKESKKLLEERQYFLREMRRKSK